MTIAARMPERTAAAAGGVDDGLSPASIRAFCHDCRTPLAVISEFAGIVCDDLDPQEAGEGIELLSIIRDRVWDIETLLGGLQFLHAFPAENPVEVPHREPVTCMLTVLEAELETVTHRWGHELELGAAHDPLLCLCQPAAFREIVLALLNDLCRSSLRPGTVHVQALADIDAGILDVCLWRGESWTPANLIGGSCDVPAPLRSFRQQFAGTVLSRCGGRLIARRSDADAAFIMQFTLPGSEDVRGTTQTILV